MFYQINDLPSYLYIPFCEYYQTVFHEVWKRRRWKSGIIYKFQLLFDNLFQFLFGFLVTFQIYLSRETIKMMFIAFSPKQSESLEVNFLQGAFLWDESNNLKCYLQLKYHAEMNIWDCKYYVQHIKNVLSYANDL